MFTSWCFSASSTPPSRILANRNGSNTSGSAYRASSVCAVTDAAATSVPFGMRVPSESVTSFTALRKIPTVGAR